MERKTWTSTRVAVLGDLKRYEEILLAVLAFAGFAYWWYSRRRA